MLSICVWDPSIDVASLLQTRLFSTNYSTRILARFASPLSIPPSLRLLSLFTFFFPLFLRSPLFPPTLCSSHLHRISISFTLNYGRQIISLLRAQARRLRGRL